ncbi:MAG: VOC family protein [Streptosporangiales bacterium]|nr:VOC family protein [Streptosporangiales bacterium]
MTTTLQPRLIVSDAAKALAFYADALGAEVHSKHTDDDGLIVNADLTVAGAPFTVKDETPGTTDLSPTSFGGTPVLLRLTVPDVDALGARMERAGATVVFPISDHPYGRMGRFTDPYGHIWMLSQSD